jgi:hypothetical protein
MLEQNFMKNFWIIVFFILVSVKSGFSQFGIGAAGGTSYPGMLESEPTGNHFQAGWGYELFIRHNLIKISDSFVIDGRYAYRHYTNEIELPFVLSTWFSYNYLTLCFLTTIKKLGEVSLYTGIGGSLVNITADKDFFDFTDSIFLPEIIFGSAWQIGSYYNLFGEISFQHSHLNDVLHEKIPLTGIRFIVGATMFLIE